MRLLIHSELLYIVWCIAVLEELHYCFLGTQMNYETLL